MWDAFIDRTCHSCIGLSNTPSFCKRKTDLFSVEYSTYIHRDIISCFEYSMKNSNKTPRKGTPRSTTSYYEKYKNEQKTKNVQAPVYVKANATALQDKRPAYPPHCSMGEKCTCLKKFGKNVGKQDKNVAVLHIVETAKVARPPLQFKLSKTEESREVLNKKDEKYCKQPISERIEKKEVTFTYRGKESKARRQEARAGKRSDRKPQPAPIPPPPPLPPPFSPAVVKLKKNKREKKGAVLEDRTKSMALYRTILSRLNLNRWKIYKVS